MTGRVTVRRAQLGAAAGLLLLAAFVAWQSWKLRYYTALGPGPGFFPLWLSLALGVTAVAMLVNAWRDAAAAGAEPFLPGREGLLKIAAVLAVMVGTILFLESLGYRLTMLAGYLFLLYVFGRRDFLVPVAVALAGSFGVYHMFVHWLQVPLPAGPWLPR